MVRYPEAPLFIYLFMKHAHGSDVLHVRTDGVLHRSEMSRGVHEQAHIDTENLLASR